MASNRHGVGGDERATGEPTSSWKNSTTSLEPRKGSLAARDTELSLWSKILSPSRTPESPGEPLNISKSKQLLKPNTLLPTAQQSPLPGAGLERKEYIHPPKSQERITAAIFITAPNWKHK